MKNFSKSEIGNRKSEIRTSAVAEVLKPPIKTVQWGNDCVVILDQKALPFHEKYLKLRDLKQVRGAIHSLTVRGAPAIGVAAALALALEAKRYRGSRSRFDANFKKWSKILFEARPTAVNLKNALDFMAGVLEQNSSFELPRLKMVLEKAALKYFHDDLSASLTLNRHGAQLVGQNSRALTICNAGGLATSGFGTALGVLREAFIQGKSIHTYTLETRPWLQGSRLTVWELEKSKMPYTLICDSAAAFLMQREKIDLVVTGADRITRRGDVANKIGTYALACLAKYHGIPFYVAAPLSTFDSKLIAGKDIPIEERSSKEITEVRGIPVALARTKTWNPVFDVTPANLVTAFITEIGILKASDVNKMIAKDVNYVNQ